MSKQEDYSTWVWLGLGALVLFVIKQRTAASAAPTIAAAGSSPFASDATAAMLDGAAAWTPPPAGYTGSWPTPGALAGSTFYQNGEPVGMTMSGPVWGPGQPDFLPGGKDSVDEKLRAATTFTRNRVGPIVPPTGETPPIIPPIILPITIKGGPPMPWDSPPIAPPLGPNPDDDPPQPYTDGYYN